MSEHTQTPWCIVEGVVRSSNNTNVSGLVPSRMTEADAAYIVQAVNSHEALVEALKQIVEMKQDNLQAQLKSGDTLKMFAATAKLFNDCRDIAHAALAKAQP